MKKIIAACTAALLSLGAVGVSATVAWAEDAPPVETVEVATPAEVTEPVVVEEPAPVAEPVAEIPAVEPVTVPEVEEEPAVEAAVAEPTISARVAAVDQDYVTVAWIATEGDIWNPAQTTSAPYWFYTEEPELNAADAKLASLKPKLACGTSLYFQVDVYIDDDVTAALLAGGVLNGPSDPTEHLIPGGEGTAWKYVKVTADDCPPPPTNSTCTTFSDGGTSTNLDANGWVSYDTRSAGHAEYVDGGLHVYTDDASSNAKVSWAHAGSFPLKNTGQLAVDWSGTDPGPGINLFVNFGADGNGTLVYEPVYGQDLWLTNGSSATVKANAPVIGGGNGSQWHGTIDQWLTKYPDATVTGFAFSYGSGVHGDGVLHSISVGCATYSFDFANAPLPESHSTYTEWVDGEFECDDTTVEQTRTRVDYTYTNATDGSVVEHVSDPVVETQTRDLTKDEIEVCPTETTPPAVTPPTGSLALTGGSSPIGGILLVAFLILAGVAGVAARVRHDRLHPTEESAE